MNYKRQRWIFLILYLAYTSIYVARVNLSVAGPEMIDANIMSTVHIGALGSAFSTIYAVGRLINGGMSDRKPPWLMLTTGLAVAGLSNILVGFFFTIYRSIYSLGGECLCTVHALEFDTVRDCGCI